MRQYNGSTIQIHKDRANFLTIKLPRELKLLLLKEAEKRGGWGRMNRVAVEILANHYNRMDLAYVPDGKGQPPDSMRRM